IDAAQADRAAFVPREPKDTRQSFPRLSQFFRDVSGGRQKASIALRRRARRSTREEAGPQVAIPDRAERRLRLRLWPVFPDARSQPRRAVLLEGFPWRPWRAIPGQGPPPPASAAFRVGYVLLRAS